MELGHDTRWMTPLADPAAFVMTPVERAARAGAERRARELRLMIQMLVRDEAACAPGERLAA